MSTTEQEEINKKTQQFQQKVGGAISGHVEILLAIMGDHHGFFKDLANNGPGSCMNLFILIILYIYYIH